MANLEDVGRRGSQGTSDTQLTANPKKKAPRKLEVWYPLIFVLAFLLLWEWLARTEQISSLFFPAPTSILGTLAEMVISGRLWPHLGATLLRLGSGLLLGCLPGYLLGMLMGWSERLRIIIDPIIAAIHPLPKIAIFPLILIIFGLGEISKVIAIAIAAFFPMLINSMAGVRQINRIYFEVTKNYGASRWKTLTRVVIPGSLPLTLAGLRIAINTALVITIAVELVAADEGLGVLTWFAWETLKIRVLYAALIVLGLLGLLINNTLHLTTRRVARWHGPSTDVKI
jgi:NitT/TauT family transport system permease protein